MKVTISATNQAGLGVLDRYFFDTYNEVETDDQEDILAELERYGIKSSDVKIICFLPYNPERTEDKIGSRKTGCSVRPKSKGKDKNRRPASLVWDREYSHRRHVGATKVLKILEDLNLSKV